MCRSLALPAGVRAFAPLMDRLLPIGLAFPDKVALDGMA